MREARAGLGPKNDLMIDAGLVYDAKTAIQRARSFEEYDPFWFEEPLLPDDYEGYAKLSAATSLRIAAGEEESERKSFLQLMDVGKIDVVQIDLTRCGGFTEAIKIAALAADRGLKVVNHGFTTYLNVAAALHFDQRCSRDRCNYRTWGVVLSVVPPQVTRIVKGNGPLAARRVQLYLSFLHKRVEKLGVVHHGKLRLAFF